MRVLLAFLLLAISLLAVGCAGRDQATYVDLPPEPLSSTSDAELSSVSATSPKYSEEHSSADDSPRKPPKEQSDDPVINEKHEESEMSFADVQAKAHDVGVERLSNSDIEGLSYAQIQELRGY